MKECKFFFSIRKEKCGKEQQGGRVFFFSRIKKCSQNAVNLENKNFYSPPPCKHTHTIIYSCHFSCLFHTISHSISSFFSFEFFNCVSNSIPFSHSLSFYSSFYTKTFPFSIFIFVSVSYRVPFRSVFHYVCLVDAGIRWCAGGIHYTLYIESISLMWKMLKMPSIHASANVKCSIEPKLFQR